MIRIIPYSEADRATVFARDDQTPDVEAIVSAIIEDVRINGDDALRRYSRKFDRAELESIEVTPEETAAALAKVDPALVAVMERAAANIRAFHENQKRTSYITTGADGVVTGQRVLPLHRVGMYVPGGTATYPSSVLMDCIPARIAGVREIVMITPVSGGFLNPCVIAAAKIAGVDRVFKSGGAQAIAALAFGTESVPRVDKIVGPGNAYVQEAKKQVYGKVAIDMIAGPSEILILADAASNPAFIAADMLSQAEHDPMSSAVLITDGMALAEAVQAQIETQLDALPRKAIARKSIEQNGKIIVAPGLDTGIEIANEIAPEHLELCVDDPFRYLDSVKNAGSVFLGRWCPESLGDYYAGPNHTLPTMGTARFASPLGVDDFVKRSAFTYYTREALSKAAPDVAAFAESEGLTAHARAALIRSEGGRAE